MTTYTSHLRLTEQEVGENEDTWGLVLNEGVFELLEDSIAGLASVSVTAGHVTLTTANGASDQARCMMIEITGAPGAARNVIVPDLSKVYVVHNKTTGGQTITIKTSAGTGVAPTAGRPVIVYCDGTNVVNIANHADTALIASNASLFDGNNSTEFGQYSVQGSWTKSQATTTVTLTDGATIAVNLVLSNKFRLVLGGNRVLNNPTGVISGLSFEVIVVQDGTGSRTLSYGTKYRWPGNVAPTLTTTAGRADILTFSYDEPSDKYLGSILQNFTLT